jgi:hypothetical protein
MTGVGLGTGFVLLMTVLLGWWVARGTTHADKRPQRAAFQAARRGTLSALGLAAMAGLGFVCDDLLMAGSAGSATSTWTALAPLAAAIPGITALALVAVQGFGRLLELDEARLERAQTAPSVAELTQLQTVLERELSGNGGQRRPASLARSGAAVDVEEGRRLMEDGYPV